VPLESNSWFAGKKKSCAPKDKLRFSRLDMKTKEQTTWEKVERDQVLNLGELAVASGYSRSVLSAMKLPLIAGKISLSDFKRIVRRRQDQCESLRGPTPALSPDSAAAIDSDDDWRRQVTPATTMADLLFFGTKTTNQKRLTRKAKA